MCKLADSLSSGALGELLESLRAAAPREPLKRTEGAARKWTDGRTDGQTDMMTSRLMDSLWSGGGGRNSIQSEGQLAAEPNCSRPISWLLLPSAGDSQRPLSEILRPLAS